MKHIFLDECGHTGEDLINKKQPLFVLASHSIEEKECKELKKKYFSKVKSKELKYSLLRKRPAQQQMVLDLLRELNKGKYPIMISVVHKEYALMCKIVEMIEIAAHDDGLDLYDRGANIAMANMFYYTLPVFAGQEFYQKLLLNFQVFMREKTRQSYNDFFQPIINLDLKKHKHKKQLQDLFVYFTYIHKKYGYDLFDWMVENSLDVAFTCALVLMSRWRLQISDEIKVIHDNSKNMSQQKNIWDALMDHNIDECIVGYDRRTMKFPISVTETVFGDSPDWAGLQIGDILSGAVNASIISLMEGGEKENNFTKEVFELVEGFVEHTVWPSPEVTPHELDTEGPKYKDSIEFVVDILRKNEL